VKIHLAKGRNDTPKVTAWCGKSMPRVQMVKQISHLPGQRREEVEGVFIVRDGKAEFVAVKLGIAGERFFEVVGGIKEGDRVITGPFDSVRNLYDGDMVVVNARK
jgi:hypothetical protein